METAHTHRTAGLADTAMADSSSHPILASWRQVEDRLEPAILETRLAKEAASLPRFAAGGPWREATPTLRELHDWVHMENTAYASKRLLQERKPLDPELLKSY